MLMGWVLCALFLGLIGKAQAQAASPDEVKINALLAKYRQCVDTLDPALISEIWSSDLPVSFVHPLGTDEGLSQIKSDIFGKLMGMFSKRDLIFDTTAIHVNGNSAWVEITWTFHATWKDSGEPVTTNGRETQVLLREQGDWRLVHVHYSGPPVTVVRKGV
jgi:ketosteroid isomerase-like protein